MDGLQARIIRHVLRIPPVWVENRTSPYISIRGLRVRAKVLRWSQRVRVSRVRLASKTLQRGLEHPTVRVFLELDASAKRAYVKRFQGIMGHTGKTVFT